MKDILKTIDQKALATIITSVGGLLLAAMFGWLYFKTVTNHLHEVSQILRETTEVQRELSGAIIENTAVLQIIERRNR